MVAINLATVKHTRQAIYVIVFFLIYGCAAGPSKVEVDALNTRIARLERSLDERGAKLEDLENKFRLLRRKQDGAAEDSGLEKGDFTPPPGLKVVQLGEVSTLRIKGLPDREGKEAGKKGSLKIVEHDGKKGPSHKPKAQAAESKTNLTNKGAQSNSPSTSPAPLLSAEAMYKKARKLFLSGRDNEARAIFMEITTAYPESSLADNAFYWSAESYYRKKNFKDAIVLYSAVVEKYPRGNKAADALFGLGVIYSRTNDGAGARAAWERIIKDYPDSEAAVSALKRLKLL